MNGQTTNYTLDLNSGLTQVLSDDTTTYTYGLGRISQTNTTTEYFLGDALGSVRQLVTTSDGEVTFAQTYDPYGTVTSSSGLSHTDYGFTGETTDANGLVYLRARYYHPADGRFTSRDTWSGDVNRPLSLNRWGYVEGNPINLTDPTGYAPIPPLPKQPCKEHGGWRYCILNYGGYIDTDHYTGGKSYARDTIKKLEDKKGVFNAVLPFSRTFFHVLEYETTYVTRIPINMDGKTMTSVALGILLDFEYNFEVWQWIDPRCEFLNNKGCSSFSNEDLPSDYLGFVDFVTKDKGFNEIIDDLGGGWASDVKPGHYSSLPSDFLTASPNGVCGEGTSRNTDCTLKIYDPETMNFINKPWPSNHPYLSIRPSGFGIYWGRSIFDFGQDPIPAS